MKNLFNDISQDEKNRILEMHSAKKNIISEQGIQQIPDFGAETQPNPRLKPKPTPKPIDNISVNLYKDKGETQLLSTFEILKPVKEGNTIKIMIDNKGRVGGVVRYLEFKCGESPVVYLNGTNPQNFKERTVTPMALYNLKFVTELKEEYCGISRGGKSVPKADYTMNNQSTDAATGIA
jgi:hypothetical protein